MTPSSPIPPAEFAPVAPQERVQLYDVLRGFCLFGVLWSNLNAWPLVAQPATALDHGLQWAEDWLLGDRFYTMLGFLFGIGFALQLTRAAQRGQDGRNLFLRRMAVLLAIGLVHALLLWDGDILIDYAVVGFILVLFRRLPARKLLIAAAAVYLVYPYLAYRLRAALGMPMPVYRGDVAWAYAHGTWVQAMTYRIGHFSILSYLLSEGPAEFLTLFLLGLWAVRVDLIARLIRRRIYIFWALFVALVCWGSFQYLDPMLTARYPGLILTGNWRQISFWVPGGIVLRGLDSFLIVLGNSAVYALSIALAMSYPAIAKRLEPLAMLGRMTLTTYLTQTVVCTTLFYGWGFGLMNKINLSGVLAVTVVLFTLQIGFSMWWLKRYRFGPAEWLWRSLAYGKRLPNRIASKLTPANVTA